MKILLPLTKERFRLLEDWPTTFLARTSNQYVQEPLPAGSIISFDRVLLNKVSKPNQPIKVSIRVVADRADLTMRKYGGKAPYGFTTTITVAALRQIELEPVEGMP